MITLDDDDLDVDGGRVAGGATTAGGLGGEAGVLASAAGTGRQQASEGASELGVEDRVDDRVEKAVDVAEPDEEREDCRVDVADWAGVNSVPDTNGIDDVERKEREPAGQEHTCTASHPF